MRHRDRGMLTASSGKSVQIPGSGTSIALQMCRTRVHAEQKLAFFETMPSYPGTTTSRFN
eukprot:1381725-Rhodomonas_salina.1